jgi:hypothetical protein
VFNARGLVCGCVNRAQKFMPQAQVMFWKESEQKCTLCRFGLTLHDVHMRGLLAYWYGMLMYVLIPTTSAPRGAHVGN